MNCKITVVVPVYNMKSYLDRCLPPLLKQSFQDYEMILVDDGSTDGSSALCDRYALRYPGRIRCIHKENGGLSSARNAGMLAAAGEYVIFPDPDDWVDQDYLANLSDIVDSGADLACIGYLISYPEHEKKGTKDCGILTLNREEAMCCMLRSGNFGGFAWNKLYRLSIIQNNSLLFENDVGITEDLDFAYRYLKFAEKIVYASEKRSYHYFQRPGAATHCNYSEKMVKALHTYEKIATDDSCSSRVRHLAKEELCNTSVNVLLAYERTDANDSSNRRYLRKTLTRNLTALLSGDKYGLGRKLQALCAWISPALYCAIKNKWENRK